MGLHGGKLVNSSSIDPLLVVAHELKEPLALIRYLSLAISSGASQDDDSKRRAIEQIYQTAERTLRLTTNLSKTADAQMELFSTEAVDVARILNDVKQEVLPLYRLSNREITFSKRRQSLAVVANYDLLRRVIVEFADNALHYSDVDGMVELFVQISSKNQAARIGVRDYGPALPNNVWQGLTRDARSIARRPSSSGLGLRIADSFARRMNGRVGAIRHRDGASFYVELPLSRQLSLL